MLAGPRALIDKGRLYRKRLGGGMRQAGVLAAPALIALEEMPKRLGEDHANAKWLAQKLAEIPGIAIDASKVESNIVIFDVSGTGHTGSGFSAALKERGILMNAINDRLVRAVTHYDVTRADCERAMEAMASLDPVNIG